jgi:hypothetical protein
VRVQARRRGAACSVWELPDLNKDQLPRLGDTHERDAASEEPMGHGERRHEELRRRPEYIGNCLHGGSIGVDGSRRRQGDGARCVEHSDSATSELTTSGR